ncbi:MAG: hypothetical protein HQ567_08065 [Candidatus Nealsonbacteria bacterium]|nr:hypothetical protein [Candidatus Nealsonbacteria bacterium]
MFQHGFPHNPMCVMVSLVAATCGYGAEIPFPAALDGASISYEGLQRIEHDALIVGNGDLAGLIYEKDGGIALKVSKNDVWDARLDAHLASPSRRPSKARQRSGATPNWSSSGIARCGVCRHIRPVAATSRWFST